MYKILIKDRMNIVLKNLERKVSDTAEIILYERTEIFKRLN